MIKFNLHNVTDGVNKAKVWYSYNPQKECIIVHAKSYSEDLSAVFPKGVQNNSNMMVDYFEKDRIIFYKNDEFFGKAMEAMHKLEASRKARREKR